MKQVQQFSPSGKPYNVFSVYSRNGKKIGEAFPAQEELRDDKGKLLRAKKGAMIQIKSELLLDRDYKKPYIERIAPEYREELQELISLYPEAQIFEYINA